MYHLLIWKKRTKRILYCWPTNKTLRIYSTYSPLLEMTRLSTLMLWSILYDMSTGNREDVTRSTVLYGELSIIASCCVASLRACACAVRVATKHLPVTSWLRTAPARRPSPPYTRYSTHPLHSFSAFLLHKHSVFVLSSLSIGAL